MKSYTVTPRRAYGRFNYSAGLTLLALICVGLMAAHAAQAQNSNTPPTTGTQAPAVKPAATATPKSTEQPDNSGGQSDQTPDKTRDTTTPAASQTSKVVCVYRDGYEADANSKGCAYSGLADWNSAGIGDIIIVKVQGLRGLLKRAKCQDENGGQTPNCNPQDVALFLDGRKIRGIVPESGAPEADEGTLQFHLQRSAQSDEEWADLLGAPRIGNDFFYRRNTPVAVGLENGYAEETTVKRFNIVRIREWRFWVWSVVLLFVLVLLLWLARSTNLLRDVGPDPDGGRLRPYSLGRFQMAVWFFLVIASFVYIWQITGALDIITTSVLGLIGIGAGTALGSAAIDVGKRTDTESQLQSLQAEKQALESELPALDTKINEATVAAPTTVTSLQQLKTAHEARLNLVNDQVGKLSVLAAPQASERFLNDILTGANGISFHRFQMFVWTIILALIFIHQVWSRLSMPDFPATLLALMGISAGTFIGFKIPEKQA